MNHIALALLTGVVIFGFPLFYQDAVSLRECPKGHEGERLAYSTYYPDGKVICTYVQHVRGMATRSIKL